MKKNSILITFMLAAISGAKAQQIINNDSKQVVDTFVYVTFDIRDSKSYPIIMSGVTKKIALEKVSKENKMSFIEGFYQNAYYVPDLLNGYEQMLRKTIGDKIAVEYLHQNPMQAEHIMAKIEENSVKKNDKT